MEFYRILVQIAFILFYKGKKPKHVVSKIHLLPMYASMEEMFTLYRASGGWLIESAWGADPTLLTLRKMK